jgi:hypothetical protein
MSKHRKLSEREIRINKFYKFLIDNDAFVEYRENVRRERVNNLNIIFRTKAPYWITTAFLYSESNEGAKYWIDLNMKWREYCETEGIS